jgi:hypothetical protein
VGGGAAAAPGLADLALAAAIGAVAAGALRLALTSVPAPEDTYLLAVPLRVWLRFLEMLRLVPWEEGALLAVLWLEVLHSSRPWHTAVLGAPLVAYLLSTHLAETDAAPRVLRPQARVLAAGAALLALGAGAGMLPAVAPGAGSALLRLVAGAHSSPRPGWCCRTSPGPGAAVEHRQGQAGRWGFTRINRRAGPDGGDRQGRAYPAALDR